MRQLVSFQKLKLTNNHLDPFGHVSVQNMRFDVKICNLLGVKKRDSQGRLGGTQFLRKIVM